MMIKYAALISVLVVMGEGQRSPYAGSPNRYPHVQQRFQDEADAAAAAAAAAQSTTAPSVGNRVGEASGNSTTSVDGVAPAQAPVAGAVAPVTTSTTVRPTSELPVLALGQADFVDRIQTWPIDQRPFWYTNREQIASHLNPVRPINVVRPDGGASFFAGRK